MNTKILQILKTTYPSESSNLGAITIKIILYKKNNNFGCSVGEGEPNWVIENGRVLEFEEAKTFFSNIDNVYDFWLPKK